MSTTTVDLANLPTLRDFQLECEDIFTLEPKENSFITPCGHSFGDREIIIHELQNRGVCPECQTPVPTHVVSNYYANFLYQKNLQNMRIIDQMRARINDLSGENAQLGSELSKEIEKRSYYENLVQRFTQMVAAQQAQIALFSKKEKVSNDLSKTIEELRNEIEALKHASQKTITIYHERKLVGLEALAASLTREINKVFYS